MSHQTRVTTGLPELDDVIDGLRIGDNVVFQVNHIDVYRKYAQAFVQGHEHSGRRLIYIRFAKHPPVIATGHNVQEFQIDADSGFETFTSQIHDIITREGREVFYVFDSLSHLLDSWATDSMIANFFKVTCPYLYELNTIAYFATLRNRNSFQTMAAIRDTTQVLIDVHETPGKTYVHPLKAAGRYSPTMFLPHIAKGKRLIPLTSSGDAASLQNASPPYEVENPERHLDYWDRLFLKASELYLSGKLTPEQEEELVERLGKVLLSRDPKFLPLLRKYFTLEDILNTKARLIGSGYIGGKALGMLLARKMLLNQNKTWAERLEAHDSFYVGSDVYYSFLVENGLWKLKMEQRRPENYFTAAAVLREKILQGRFNDRIKHEFLRMLEYFGQAPIIVRSSSLLEDAFGNAFAGKYESVFCVNQGTLEERYAKLEEAIRLVFASAMGEDALTYRLQRGLAAEDEQMALLIQRVSGSHKHPYFFPDAAGVGFSHNAYVWDRRMTPQAGMVRIVCGLGTRAVNRIEGDYARIAALDHPLLKPYDDLQSFKEFSQHHIDVLNIAANRLESRPLQELVDQKVDLKLKFLAEKDREAEQKMKQLGLKSREAWVLTFDHLLGKTDFPAVMRHMLQTLEALYNYPVDIEFTVNFQDDGSYKINLLQCRPLQVWGTSARVQIPENVPREKILFQSSGHFMGGSLAKAIDLVLYVDPQAYYRLSSTQKYAVARTIGKINRLLTAKNKRAMLIGPGRWGTSTPSLGVPVMFSEINYVDVLVELGYREGGYAPELSYGTHFFQDLVESGIFYVALFPDRPGVLFQEPLLRQSAVEQSPIPISPDIAPVLRVYDLQGASPLEVLADILQQKVLAYFPDLT